MKKILIYGILSCMLLLIGCGGMEEQKAERREKILKERKKIEPETKEARGKIKTLDDIFKQMEWGNIVFNVPEFMELNQTSGIQLLLSKARTIKQLERRIREAGTLRHRKIRISKIMMAVLKGGGFKIEPITEAVQLVNMRGDTEWKWDITAIEAGSQRLHLTVNAIVNVDGTDRTHVIESLTEVIEIHVSWQQHVSMFVGDNWQWLWSAVLIPFVGWLWERRRKKR